MNYGSIWVDLEGTTIKPEERAILQHPNTGGVLLFTKNFISKTQISDLVSAIRECAAKDLIIAVDHEGGRIWRFEEGFTRPAGAQFFGELYLRDPQLALQQIKEAAQIIASELLACGIDLSFAPVLDLEHGVSTVIRERSYGRDPKVVIACARAFIAGFKSQGMRAVGKHFPGHGGCSMDSHFMHATDPRTLAEVAADDMQPFAALHTELTGVMPAHVLYPNIDPSLTGFSKFWLQEILRKKIGFAGAIISDCLSMQGSGFSTDMARGIEAALTAGCDMVIASQQTREYLLKVLEDISWQMSNVQSARIHALAADPALLPVL